MISPHIDLLKDHENKIFRQFGVLKIGIFGSFARGEEKTDSDIDIFVEFAQGQKTFDNYMGLKNFPESLFQRRVDLVTYDGLHPRIRDTVLSEIVYAS